MGVFLVFVEGGGRGVSRNLLGSHKKINNMIKQPTCSFALALFAARRKAAISSAVDSVGADPNVSAGTTRAANVQSLYRIGITQLFGSWKKNSKHKMIGLLQCAEGEQHERTARTARMPK